LAGHTYWTVNIICVSTLPIAGARLSKRGKKLSEGCRSTNHGRYYEYLIYKRLIYVTFKMLCCSRLEKGLFGNGEGQLLVNGSDTVVST